MKWSRTFSDRERVERIDRFEQRYRPWLAAGAVFFLFFCVGLGIWLYRLVSQGIYPLMADPIVHNESHGDSFVIGLGIGFHAGNLFYLATWSFVMAICFAGSVN